MPANDSDKLSADEAARVWGHAAQLQAEASGQTAAGENEDQAGLPAPTGYSLEQVRSAAAEVGIASEFVETALADIRLRRAVPATARGHRFARRFLADPPDTLTAYRVVDASPEDVLEAMRTVLPAEPFRLALTDQRGAPLEGGVLVFDIPGQKNPFERGFVFDTREAGLRQVFISLRAGADESTCEITAQSPVTSQNLGAGVGLVLSALGGGVGFGVIGALGLVVGLGPVGAVGGVLLGGGLGMKGFRALYASALRRAEAALEGMLGAVAVRASGGW